MPIKDLKTMKKLVVTVCVLALVFQAILPSLARAQSSPNSVPTSVVSTSDYNSTSYHTKEFTLDGLAWQAAKILVQQITASTVKWINSGFQGSPAFLTNPAGYFANIGDQITGAFISDTGILSGLCSPFSVDLRLALALGQVNGNNRPYTCTLNSVINNVQNSTVNGMSIGGFMNGDFSQGGWPAFIALSEPQNNESGAYLQAHSDLLQRIGAKQSTVNQQLSQGNGFLSYENCTDVANDTSNGSAVVPGSTFGTGLGSSLSTYGTLGLAGTQSGGTQSGVLNSYTGSSQASSLSVNPKTGNAQNCITETPGSVINASLEKTLGSGIDQLNLANSINQIVGALMGQLVTQVLQGGLAHSSQTSSGVTQSYIDQLSAEANGTGQFAGSSNSINGSLNQYVGDANNTVTIYNEIMALFAGINTELSSAQTCFNNLASSTGESTAPAANPLERILSGLSNLINLNTVPGNLSKISATSTKLYAIEAGYQTKRDQASTTADAVNIQAANAANVQSVNDLQNSSQTLQTFISNEVPVIEQNLTTAQADLTTAQIQAQQFDASAKEYIKNCQSLGGTVPATTP